MVWLLLNHDDILGEQFTTGQMDINQHDSPARMESIRLDSNTQTLSNTAESSS